MIICPTCKEDIEGDSRFCDQCGQALVYCSSCGRVGKGRRCIYCGGLMVTADELEQKRQTSQTSLGLFGQNVVTADSAHSQPTGRVTVTSGLQRPVPLLTLYNDTLNIRIVGQNGAVIGRRQGPYTQFFQDNMYVSGVHAQLMYTNDGGWSVIDKHSSNGTKLNDRSLMPDVAMSLRNGDILTLANVSMQVVIDS